MCRDLKLPTTYLCGKNCPANPGAWKLHGVFHKKLRKLRKTREDGGATQQRDRETAEKQARIAAQSGSAYSKLLAEAARYGSQEDWRRSARAFREAIALEPDESMAYFNLGATLANSGHHVEAAQRYLEAREHYPVGPERWAEVTANAFNMLSQEECAEVVKPEWWNDEELKALSARVLRAAPDDFNTNDMRGLVLSGKCGAWEAGPRSSVEFMEAAARYERAAALCDAPAVKAKLAGQVAWCRIWASRARAMP